MNWHQMQHNIASKNVNINSRIDLKEIQSIF